MPRFEGILCSQCPAITGTHQLVYVINTPPHHTQELNFLIHTKHNCLVPKMVCEGIGSVAQKSASSEEFIIMQLSQLGEETQTPNSDATWAALCSQTSHSCLHVETSLCHNFQLSKELKLQSEIVYVSQRDSQGKAGDISQETAVWQTFWNIDRSVWMC